MEKEGTAVRRVPSFFTLVAVPVLSRPVLNASKVSQTRTRKPDAGTASSTGPVRLPLQLRGGL